MRKRSRPALPPEARYRRLRHQSTWLLAIAIPLTLFDLSALLGSGGSLSLPVLFYVIPVVCYAAMFTGRYVAKRLFIQALTARAEQDKHKAAAAAGAPPRQPRQPATTAEMPKYQEPTHPRDLAELN